MKKLLPFIVAVLAVITYNASNRELDTSSSAPQADTVERASAERASAEWRSGQQVRGSGVVSRVLPDDNDGSRHQRFILQLDSGRTLLIAHNIDLAPRIPSLRPGDRVGFSGEYEWNDRGGVIHWTHHDPQGRHEGGWLEHAGRRYE